VKLGNFVRYNSAPRGFVTKDETHVYYPGSCHKRQKPQEPTPQSPIRNRKTKKVANAKGLNRNTDLTELNLT